MLYSWCKKKLLLCSGITLLSIAAQADYSTHPRALELVNTLVEKHKFDRKEVLDVLAKAEKQEKILAAIARPAEKTKPWYEYRKIFLDQTRIDQGVEFWQKNAATLERAAKTFKVDPQIIVAIIGVETRYGRHAGTYRVIDALATLGFDYEPRADFFRGELEHAFLLAREQKQDLLALKGSYAGAMGYGQFIPSSYRNFAVDFDGDNIADIWNNPVDAIGSVANYFAKHKWQQGEMVFERARIRPDYVNDELNSKVRPHLTLAELQKLGFTAVDEKLNKNLKAVALLYDGKNGKEFWLGFDNFYVITRYNRSQMYAMAAWELSNEILAGYRVATTAANTQAANKSAP